jgi:hypothetical protein
MYLEDDEDNNTFSFYFNAEEESDAHIADSSVLLETQANQLVQGSNGMPKRLRIDGQKLIDPDTN